MSPAGRGRLVCCLVAAAALTGPGAHAVTALESPAYVRADNLLLWQAGRDPRSEASTTTSLFDQFELEYGRGGFRAGLRYETFRPSREQGFVPARYEEIPYRFAEWSGSGLRLNVGHGFATVGRGLLFRAFELRGVVRDAVFPAAQYVDSRSLDGVILEATRGPLTVLAFSGEPVRYPDVPPGVPDLPRREGRVDGGRAALAVAGAVTAGVGYLRSETALPGAPPERRELASADLDLRAARLFSALAEADADLRIYAEYAGRARDPLRDGFATDAATPHALYTAVQLSYRRWGASFETKDYADFALGWNDPPNLVPEMPQHLLNRMSHFLLAERETGRQFSLMGALPGGWSLQVESARAHNDVNGLRRYRLDAVVVEGDPLGAMPWQVFAGVGRDEVEGITDHRTVGASATRDLGGGISVRLAAEHQRAERTTFGEARAFDDVFVSLGFDRAGLGSLAVQAEFSGDPDERDDPTTFDVVETDPRSWAGVVVAAPLDANHEATLFLGSRRGGTACTSGTCYLVPDFTGAELRLISRF